MLFTASGVKDMVFKRAYVFVLFDQDCPAELHQLMLECWHQDRQTRPTFTRVVSKLEHIEQYPDILKTLASPASTG